MREIETIIVGAGQAGLSAARYLKEGGRPFLILEKNEKIGEPWRNRYDSLVLDSYAKYTGLEGFPFWGSRWGDPSRHPLKGEVVDYLQAYAKHFGLAPQFSTEVLKLEKKGDEFIVHTSKGDYRAKNVVLATGPFHKPFVPKTAENIPKDVYQIHSSGYKNPHQLKNGPVLVVGSGNSGVEIAEELLEAGKKVLFSYRGKLKSVRSTPLSQWLAYTLGLAHVPKDTLLGRIIIWYTRGKPVGVNVSALLKHPNVISVGPFDVEMAKKASNIIWATGYESDFSIISVPGFNPALQKRGVTNIPGLYILNMRWQHAKSSSHLAGISRDAKYIARHIMRKSSDEKPD